MSQSKVLQDIDGLIDLFLSPDFDPRSKGDSATNLQEFSFESEISDGPDEFRVDSVEFVGSGHQSVPAPPPPHFKHDEFFTKKCGRVFAKLGDEYIGVQQRYISNELQRAVQPLENKSEDKEVQNSSWESFKQVLDNYIAATSEGEAPKVLGAILLTIRGLSHIGSGAKSCVKNFTRKFIRERGLDREIARIGGLNGIMATQLD